VRISQKDLEQEVRGIAIPVVDVVSNTCRSMLEGNPIVDAISDIITVDDIHEGEDVRAVDVPDSLVADERKCRY
jgi:hypothetical protein